MGGHLYHIVMEAPLWSFQVAPAAWACGYIDPGTGSLMIQLILGVLFGGLFVIKLSWKRIAQFLKKVITTRGKTLKK